MRFKKEMSTSKTLAAVERRYSFFGGVGSIDETLRFRFRRFRIAVSLTTGVCRLS
jgi:hypothetical protein